MYGASGCIDELYRRLVQALEKVVDEFEIIMVNDASPDDSWQKIVALGEQDSRLRGLNLSRNFGQHYAIVAGIDHAKGDWVVVMDCDLQHAPEDIERLCQKAGEGYDVVLCRRINRQDPLLKRAASKAFGFVYNYLSDVNLDDSVSTFSLITRRVADTMRNLRERNRSYVLLLIWIGFDTAYIDVEHSERFAGKSSYSFGKSLKLAIDSIASQSDRPLRISIKFGFMLSFLSLLYGVHLVFQHFFVGVGVAGWRSIIVSLFLIGGLLFTNIGVVGLYLGKVFEETKNRPLYAVKRSVNIEALTWPDNLPGDGKTQEVLEEGIASGK